MKLEELYVGVIDKDPKSDYGVRFPDFPGCISCGGTMDELSRMGSEALELCVESMVEDAENIPSPSSLEKVKADSEYRNAYAYMFFPVARPDAHTKRINISLPEYVLNRADRFARRRKIRRSRLISEALLDYIAESR